MSLPKVEEHGVTTKKLEQVVDMAAELHDFSELESIWKLQRRGAPTSIQKKMLGKQDRAAQKAEQRNAEPVVRKKKPESTATASQSPIKNWGFEERGIGKTTLLKIISSEQLRIPSGINLLVVEQEVEGDDTRVIDAVLTADQRRQTGLEMERVLQARLCKENLSEAEENKWNKELSKLYTEMENLQLDKTPARAASILYGRGFTPDEQKKPTKLVYFPS